jgi:hypothetical protein
MMPFNMRLRYHVWMDRISNAHAVRTTTRNLHDLRFSDHLVCRMDDKETQRKVLAEKYNKLMLDCILQICEESSKKT